MLVKDVMSKDVVFATPQQNLMAVARLMRDEDVGAIPVVQDEASKKLVGIITDRDIVVRAVAEGKNPATLKVEPMPGDLVTCKPDDDLQRCAQLMQERQVRRIPVVDEKGTLIGIVAQADVAKEENAEVVKQTVGKISEAA